MALEDSRGRGTGELLDVPTSRIAPIIQPIKNGGKVINHQRIGRPPTLPNELRRISKPVLANGLTLSSCQVPQTLSDNYQDHLQLEAARPANPLFVPESIVLHRKQLFSKTNRIKILKFARQQVDNPEWSETSSYSLTCPSYKY